MGKDAPDAKAQELASKLLGTNTDSNAMAALMGGARMSDEAPATQPKEDKQDDNFDPDLDFLSSDDDEEDDLPTDRDDDDDDQDGTDADEADDQLDEDEDQSDEDDNSDERAEFDYDDEDEIEVIVDGEAQDVSLRDLKRVFSLHGATEKRLKEVTVLRQQATAELETARGERQQYHENMLSTIQQLDQVLFAPLIDAPDPKLRTRNMNEYLQQKDAYEEDQKRINEGRTALATALGQERNAIQEAKQNHILKEQQVLFEKVPAFKDPQKAEKLRKSIYSAASHYGFGPELVSQVEHHGLFMMALDAARWLNMQKVRKSTGKTPTSRATGPKRLKPGGPTNSKKRSLARQQQQKQAVAEKARTSGRADDVVDFLVNSARTVKGKSNGRRS